MSAIKKIDPTTDKEHFFTVTYGWKLQRNLSKLHGIFPIIGVPFSCIKFGVSLVQGVWGFVEYLAGVVGTIGACVTRYKPQEGKSAWYERAVVDGMANMGNAGLSSGYAMIGVISLGIAPYCAEHVTD